MDELTPRLKLTDDQKKELERIQKEFESELGLASSPVRTAQTPAAYSAGTVCESTEKLPSGSTVTLYQWANAAV